MRFIICFLFIGLMIVLVITSLKTMMSLQQLMILVHRALNKLVSRFIVFKLFADVIALESTERTGPSKLFAKLSCKF